MKSIKILCFLALFSITGIAFYACNNASATNPVDVVNGTQPVDFHDIEWRINFMKKLQPLTPEQRKIEIDKVSPRLNGSIMANLRNGGFNCENVKITYKFGSGEADSVASGDGKKYSGYFKDQLYAIAKSPDCIKDSVTLFVQCFNGYVTLKIDESNQNQTIGTYSTVFTIEKPWGLNRYVDYLTSIWIAEKFGRPIHKGEGWKGKIITPEEARGYENILDQQAVTVEVFPGDVFDLGNMTYNGKPAIK